MYRRDREQMYQEEGIGEVYDPSTMGPAPTGQAAIDEQLSAAFKQLHAINVSMTTERARGNQAGVVALIPLYQKWLDEYKYWSRQAGVFEFGSFDQFLLSMQNFANSVVSGTFKTFVPLLFGAVAIYALVRKL